MAEENPIKEGAEKVEAAIKSEPWYVWAGAAAAAGVMVYFVWKRRQAAASTSASTESSSQGTSPADAAQLNGYQVDSMAGLPYGEMASGYNYQEGPVDNYPGGYSEVGVNGNQVPIVPYGDTPIFDSNGNLIGWQQPNPSPNPPPPPTQNPPPPAPQTFTLTQAYIDQHHHSGVLHAVAKQFGITYDALFQANKTQLGGNENKAKYKANMVLTIPQPAPATGQGDGGVPDEAGGFHLAVNKGRNTVDQWTFSNGMHQGFDAYAPVGE